MKAIEGRCDLRVGAARREVSLDWIWRRETTASCDMKVSMKWDEDIGGGMNERMEAWEG